MNKKDNDLSGFHDFLDDPTPSTRNKKNYKKKQPDDFELLTFLETDSKRLDLHLRLFQEKSFMLKNYPQEIEVLLQLEKHRDKLKSDATALLKSPDSGLMKSLAELFNPHFRA